MKVVYSILFLAVMALVSGCATYADRSSGDAVKEAKVSASVKRSAGFDVYSDERSPGNHFIPAGWMGDTQGLEVDQGCIKMPHSGSTCIKVTYKPSIPGPGWAGIYWQNPANNWGDTDGGFDLTGSKRLSFWARGAKGDEVCEFKMGGIQGQYSDSDSATTGPVTLSGNWQMFNMDLSMKDLSYISGGFCWVAKAGDNPDGLVVFIDDIKYE